MAEGDYGFAQVVAASGTLAIAGGDGAPFRSFELTAGTWTERAPLPVAIAGSFSAALDGDTAILARTVFDQSLPNAVFVLRYDGAAWEVEHEQELVGASAHGVDVSGDVAVFHVVEDGPDSFDDVVS